MSCSESDFFGQFSFDDFGLGLGFLQSDDRDAASNHEDQFSSNPEVDIHLMNDGEMKDIKITQLDHEFQELNMIQKKATKIRKFYKNLRYAQFVETDSFGDSLKCWNPPKEVVVNPSFTHPCPNITPNRLELNETEQITFRKIIRDSVILRRKFRISSRFDQLCFDAGLTAMDLKVLSETCFDPDVIKDFLNEKWSLKGGWDGTVRTLKPVIHILYNESGEKNGVVRMETNLHKIFEWRINSFRELNSLTQDDVLNDSNLGHDIDWDYVSKRMLDDLNRDFNARQCQVIWKRYLSPNVRLPPSWTKEDFKKLTNLTTTSLHRGFIEIAKEMGDGFNPIVCLNVYLKHIKPKLKNLNQKAKRKSVTRWSPQIEFYFCRLMKEGNGSFEYASMGLCNAFNGQFPIEFLEKMWYKLRPFKCDSRFHPLEDAILLATIEKIKNVSQNKIHLIDLVDIELPWRDAKHWIRRFGKLMNKYHYKMMGNWTITEDAQLLTLVAHYKRRWKLIAKHFTNPPRSKDRLLARYLILKRQLQRETLYDYHQRRSNKKKMAKLTFRHLKKAHFILKKVAEKVPIPLPGSSIDTENVDLNSSVSRNQDYVLPITRPPNEYDFVQYLQNIDIKYVRGALFTIQDFLESQNDSPAFSSLMDLERIMKSDRRVFNRSDPQSVASALQLRRIRLKTKAELEGCVLSPFQRRVIDFHSNFYKLGTKRLKQNILNYIPKSEYLLTLPEIQGILKSQKSVLNAMRKIKQERNSKFLNCNPDLPQCQKNKDLEYILPDLIPENSGSSTEQVDHTENIHPPLTENTNEESTNNLTIATFGKGKRKGRLRKLRKEVAAMRWEAERLRKQSQIHNSGFVENNIEDPHLVLVELCKEETKAPSQLEILEEPIPCASPTIANEPLLATDVKPEIMIQNKHPQKSLKTDNNLEDKKPRKQDLQKSDTKCEVILNDEPQVSIPNHSEEKAWLKTSEFFKSLSTVSTNEPNANTNMIFVTIQTPKPGQNYVQPIKYKEKVYLPICTIKGTTDEPGLLKIGYLCSDVKL